MLLKYEKELDMEIEKLEVINIYKKLVRTINKHKEDK